MRAAVRFSASLLLSIGTAPFLDGAIQPLGPTDRTVLTSMLPIGGSTAASIVPDFSVRPDGDHPLFSASLYGLTVAPSAPLAAQSDRLLATVSQPAAPNGVPALRLDSVSLPLLGQPKIVGARLQFPQGPGSHFEFRVDRPAAAFIMRF